MQTPFRPQPFFQTRSFRRRRARAPSFFSGGGPPAALLVNAVGLRAPAVRDLMALGVADFVRPPFCPDELRARLTG